MFDIQDFIKKALPAFLGRDPSKPATPDVITEVGNPTDGYRVVEPPEDPLFTQVNELADMLKGPIPPEHLHEVLILFVGKLALDRMDAIAGGLKVLTDKLSAKLNEKEAQDARK